MNTIQKFMQFLAEYGLPYDFPVDVEVYAQKLDTSIQSR